MNQYYILSRDIKNKLHYFIWPADNIDQLIDSFKNARYTVGHEIVNFTLYVPGQPDPDWYKFKETGRTIGVV